MRERGGVESDLKSLGQSYWKDELGESVGRKMRVCASYMQILHIYDF